MRYYKIINGNYISVIGSGNGGEEITAEEHASIMNIIQEMPTAPAGYGYRLTDALTWELYELPVEEDPDEDLTAEEALGIILGGAAE